MIPPEYNGREQTLIKHEFLTEYIEDLAFKKLYHNQILNYVDALAGPWGTKDIDGLSDTSFDLTMKRLGKVKAILEKKLNKPVEIRFCLCEKEEEAFKKLQEYSKKSTDYKIKIFLFPGKFEDQLGDISKICKTGFTFTFIDPTGWKIDSDLILKFLKDQNGEFLINFMAEHINRHATYAQVSKSIGLFLANPKWEAEFNSLSNERSIEVRILTLLKKKIKDSGAAKYTPDFSIQKPRENRLKMRLLLGTNSPMGLEVFRDVQEPVEKLEIKIRNQLRIKGRTPLFDVDELNDLEHKSEGIGNKTFREKAENRIVKFLNEGPSRFDNISNYILENVSIRLTQLKDLLIDMKQRSKIVFDLPEGKRKPQEDTIISLGNKPLF